MARGYGSRLRTIAPQARNYSPVPAARGGQGNYGAVSPASTLARLPPPDVLPRPYRGPMGPAMPMPPVNGIIDASRYVTFQSYPFTVAPNQDTVILQRPTTTRVYLFIVNTTPVPAVPTDFLDDAFFVAFDRPATLADTPLVAGGGAFEWLYTIPQNIIHVFTDEAEAVSQITGSLIFAELDPCAVNCDTLQSYQSKNAFTPPEFAPTIGEAASQAISALVPEPI
ncbi:MAG: hypothetical protein ACREUQ_04050, partial [Burkholderiales bacterium]